MGVKENIPQAGISRRTVPISGKSHIDSFPFTGNNSAVDILTKAREDLRSKRGRAREISEKTGLPLSTLYRLRDGQEDAKYSTVEKLRALYEAEAA